MNRLCIACVALSTFLAMGARSCCEDGKQEKLQKDVILATTTSTYDSGLLDVLVPMFEKHTGYVLKTIAVGSGQAMAMGERGEADVLLVHSPEAEEEFVALGHGIHRKRVMYNDFVIVGPDDDPASIRGKKSASDALSALASSEATFVSRSDDSGTHAREMRLWKSGGVDPQGKGWYVETGLGMGKTLSVASEKSAYTITDRGTFLSLAKALHLVVLVEGDPDLFNVYHVIQANPEKHPDVNDRGAAAFADFIVSDEAQQVISTFGQERFGRPLFTPDAE